jgi:CBS domain containing-hemolysin-like protein
MTSVLPQILIGVALAATIVTSIGSKVLRHFSHRQLEVYCRARRRRELFDQILDRHDEVALTAEKLQILALVLLAASTAVYVDSELIHRGVLETAALLVVLLLGVLAVTVWIPWAVVRHWSAPFLLRTWRMWQVIYYVFWPFTIGGRLCDSFFRRLAGLPKRAEKDEEEEAFEDEIMTMVNAGQREGFLEADAREMIEGVMELGDADVADIMTPRHRVDALDVDLSWQEMLKYATECGRTRMPVYERSLDNIIGVLYVKDLLPEFCKGPHEPRKSLRELMRPPWFIPSTIPLDDLLQDFRENRQHLAIVVDEYEAVEGVVTIEDVLEEIVGEIIDESDEEVDEGIRELSETKFEVLGSVHLDTLNERLSLNLPESDDFDTIAGFVISRLGRIPERGQVVEYEGVHITVREAKPRYVERVLVETSARTVEKPR